MTNDVSTYSERISLLPADRTPPGTRRSDLLRQRLRHGHEDEKHVQYGDGGREGHDQRNRPALHEVRPERRGDDHAGCERRRDEPVRERPLVLLGDVGDVSEDDAERDGEHAADADHREEPPRVYGHQGDRDAREQDRDQEEDLPAADVRQGANQRGAQEGEESLENETRLLRNSNEPASSSALTLMPIMRPFMRNVWSGNVSFRT